MTKLSPTQVKALEAIDEHGHIDVSFWGGSVWCMSVRGNINTLRALVRKGILKETKIERSTFRYSKV